MQRTQTQSSIEERQASQKLRSLSINNFKQQIETLQQEDQLERKISISKNKIVVTEIKKRSNFLQSDSKKKAAQKDAGPKSDSERFSEILKSQLRQIRYGEIHTQKRQNTKASFEQQNSDERAELSQLPPQPLQSNKENVAHDEPLAPETKPEPEGSAAAEQSSVVLKERSFAQENNKVEIMLKQSINLILKKNRLHAGDEVFQDERNVLRQSLNLREIRASQLSAQQQHPPTTQSVAQLGAQQQHPPTTQSIAQLSAQQHAPSHQITQLSAQHPAQLESSQDLDSSQGVQLESTAKQCAQSLTADDEEAPLVFGRSAQIHEVRVPSPPQQQQQLQQ